MKPTSVTLVASLLALLASHATAAAAPQGNSRDGFGVGWTGTLKRAFCVEARVEGSAKASVIELRDYDGTPIGRVVLRDPPFIQELADRTPVPAKYARVRVQVTDASDGCRRTCFGARIIR